MPPSKKQKLSHDELMRVGSADIDKQLIVVSGEKEMLTTEAELLWGQVPWELRTFTGFTTKQRALLALAFGQSKYWRRLFEERERAIAKYGVSEKEEAAEMASFTRWMTPAVMRGISGYLRKHGGRGVSTGYGWLQAQHEVPSLRAALGMGKEGMHKAMGRLKIRGAKSPRGEKIRATKISRSDALELLNVRLHFKRKNETNPAQVIWDEWSLLNGDLRGAAGLTKFKSILIAHGAKCENRPLIEPRSMRLLGT